jgi:hypothetical protein
MNHVGHGEGFARAGDTKQDLVAIAAPDALLQFVDGAWLVTPRLIFGFQFKLGHSPDLTKGSVGEWVTSWVFPDQYGAAEPSIASMIRSKSEDAFRLVLVTMQPVLPVHNPAQT